MTFEEAYTQLSSIVQRLESENLPLDDALKLFEEGQRLAAYCQEQLNQAELRVTQIVGDGSASSAE